ncbi:MAG: hypothetical protein EPN64_08825 [Burkholderiaceae bacterium]|nr:MAG: hypothetical protein EPN64_08825 [Burkholderiaceae bacterium]
MFNAIKRAGTNYVGVKLYERYTDTIIKNETGLYLPWINPNIKKGIDQLLRQKYIAAMDAGGELTGYEIAVLKLSLFAEHGGVSPANLKRIAEGIATICNRQHDSIRKDVAMTVLRQVGKPTASGSATPQKQLSAEAQELSGSIIAGAFREIARQLGVGPSSDMTDAEIVAMYRKVAGAFDRAASQKGEVLSAGIKSRIVLYFFVTRETVGEDFIDKHLDYEVDRYLTDGLRDDYRKPLHLTSYISSPSNAARAEYERIQQSVVASAPPPCTQSPSTKQPQEAFDPNKSDDAKHVPKEIVYRAKSGVLELTYEGELTHWIPISVIDEFPPSSQPSARQIALAVRYKDQNHQSSVLRFDKGGEDGVRPVFSEERTGEQYSFQYLYWMGKACKEHYSG